MLPTTFFILFISNKSWLYVSLIKTVFSGGFLCRGVGQLRRIIMYTDSMETAIKIWSQVKKTFCALILVQSIIINITEKTYAN